MNVPFLDIAATYRELKKDIDHAITDVMKSGWFILGENVRKFEEEYASFCKVKYCIGVGNGLDALEIILRALNIGPRDEVIVPANTYIATILAISYVGAKPVLVEPDLATYNIDPTKIETAITKRARVIMPVHLYGQCANMTKINKIARSHKLLVIEDAAQAQGATHWGKIAGSMGIVAGFSFCPGKNLGAFGDAGAITTNNKKTAALV